MKTLSVSGILPIDHYNIVFSLEWKSSLKNLLASPWPTLLRYFLVSHRLSAAGPQEDFLLLAPISNRGQFHHSVEGDLEAKLELVSWHLPLTMACVPHPPQEGNPRDTYEKRRGEKEMMLNLRTAWWPTTTTVSFLSSSMITGSILATKSWQKPDAMFGAFFLTS